MWVPMRLNGLSEVIGSWKTMAISGPQKCFISDFFIVDMSRPANVTVPLMSRAGPFWSSPMMVRPRTDLPEPDSPTMPRVSPAETWIETPSTARNWPRGVANTVLMLSACSSGTPF